MTTTCEPLWLDGWEQEADANAGIRYWVGEVPADYSRPCGRREIPARRVVDIIRSL